MKRRCFLQAAAFGPFLRLGRAASDELRLLAVGLGRRGTLDTLAGAHFGRVVACADVDGDKIDEFLPKLAAAQNTKPDVYQDYRKALDRKDIDVVVIGTPDHWHTRVLLSALETGRDVYCEKPLTLTINEGKKICEAVRATRRVVQVGTQQRSEFDRRFLKAVAIARSGRLGKKLSATVQIGQSEPGGPFPVVNAPAALDWNLWLGQAPKVPYSQQRCHGSFRWWFEYSGGKMTDWGAHHIDVAQWALGLENTGPIEIEATGDLPLGRDATLAILRGEPCPPATPNCFNTAIRFSVELRYANGNTIGVNGNGDGVRIGGSEGELFIDRKALTGKTVAAIEADPAESARLDEEVSKLYRGRRPGSHMRDFFECVHDRSMPISDVFTHHRTATTCHLANLAIVLGRKLRWNPEAQDFVEDREASGLMARQQRAPYTL